MGYLANLAGSKVEILRKPLFLQPDNPGMNLRRHEIIGRFVMIFRRNGSGECWAFFGHSNGRRIVKNDTCAGILRETWRQMIQRTKRGLVKKILISPCKLKPTSGSVVAIKLKRSSSPMPVHLDDVYAVRLANGRVGKNRMPLYDRL